MSRIKTALVTGAGRGVGRAVVEALHDAGWRAVAGVRDVAAARQAYADRPGVEIVQLDVTDDASVAQGVAAAESLAGGALDVLVNNAGYAVMGAIEEVDLDEVRAMFDTNLFGALRVFRAAVPAMRASERPGVIVVIGSVGARLTNPLVGTYHASKYALRSVAEAMAFELRPFAVRVVHIEPGMIATDFPHATRRSGAAAEGGGPYAPLLGDLRAGFGRWREDMSSTAVQTATAVMGSIGDPSTPFAVPVGEDAALFTSWLERDGELEAVHGQIRGFLGLNWS